MPVVIGRGGFIPGFEDGLKGAKAGDSKTINATFPEGYPRRRWPARRPNSKPW